MNRFFVFVSLTIILFSFDVNAQKRGFDINIQIDGIDDSITFLAYYRGDLTLLLDTAWNEGNGKYTFKGDTLIPEGMYIFAGQKNNKYFDILVDEDQQFKISSDTSALLTNLKVKGSKVNQYFFDYAKYLSKKQKEAKPITTRIRNGGDSVEYYRELLQVLNSDVEKFRKDFLVRNRDNFAGIFLQGTMDLDRPEIPVDENGVEDSMFLYNYYKDHYWDNIPLNDERMVRTPYFSNKLNQYLDKVVVQQPDSLIVAIDDLIERSRDAQDMYQYLVWELTIKYETAQVMGFDAIFVHLAKKYFESGIVDWLYPQVVTNIIDRANELEPLLIGKKGPNLILLDTLNQAHSLHLTQKKYTVLYFWSTDCGHCKRETPKMKEFYEQYKNIYDFEIIGINTDTSFADWKSYIREHNLPWTNVSGYRSVLGNYHQLYDIYSTPTVYVLDEHKKIIAKRILSNQLQELFEHRKKMKLD
jgi:thiol-disulfide isomerase/thioredoxin